MTKRRLVVGLVAAAALVALAYMIYTLWSPPSDGPSLLYFRSDL